MSTKARQAGWFEKFIKWIEIIGNKLPHPFWLFVYLSITITAISFFLRKAGVSVTYMAAGRGDEAASETTVAALNLMSYGAMRAFFANFVKTYVNFAPLGLIMIMTLGIGLLEQSGLISAFMRKTILGAPSWAVSATLALVGINANLASDAGIIFTPAIGGAVFKALGRNPWVGVITGFAAGCGGFTANLFVAGTDVLLAGITESAVRGIGLNAPTHPLINWYFLVIATFVLTAATTLITEKFTVKVLGDTAGPLSTADLAEHKVNVDENRGLRYALVTAVIFLATLLALTLPQGSFFRNPTTGGLVPSSPLLSGIVALLFFFFFFTGISYGLGAKVIEKMDGRAQTDAKRAGWWIELLRGCASRLDLRPAFCREQPDHDTGRERRGLAFVHASRRHPAIANVHIALLLRQSFYDQRFSQVADLSSDLRPDVLRRRLQPGADADGLSNWRLQYERYLAALLLYAGHHWSDGAV